MSADGDDLVADEGILPLDILLTLSATFTGPAVPFYIGKASTLTAFASLFAALLLKGVLLRFPVDMLSEDTLAEAASFDFAGTLLGPAIAGPAWRTSARHGPGRRNFAVLVIALAIDVVASLSVWKDPPTYLTTTTAVAHQEAAVAGLDQEQIARLLALAGKAPSRLKDPKKVMRCWALMELAKSNLASSRTCYTVRPKMHAFHHHIVY
jgi:hypothetical protein